MTFDAPLRVLLIEDSPGDARLTAALLAEVSFDRFEITHAGLLRDGLARLEDHAFDVVLLDLSLPDAVGLHGVGAIQGASPDIPIVVLTGLDDPEVSTRAVKAGAQDFLVKGQGSGELMARALRYAIERKRAGTMLLAEKERAELANRSKSEFLANISHELRTPLNAIIGFSELMYGELKGPLGCPDYKDYAGAIHDSGTHLLSIINDLLDISKVEAGRTELREEMIDLNRIFSGCLDLVAERAQQGGVSLVPPPVEPLPRIKADSRMIKQVLINLLSNAIKFTPEGGIVSLRGFIDGQGRAVVEVADTGIGIAAEDIGRALTPFAQVDSTLSRRYDGAGIGLPLSKSLVELHGGELAIVSAPGEGTSVIVTLPAERVADRAA